MQRRYAGSLWEILGCADSAQSECIQEDHQMNLLQQIQAEMEAAKAVLTAETETAAQSAYLRWKEIYEAEKDV